VAIDLFSLRMNLQTTGTAQAMGALRGVETQGARTAAGLGGVATSFNAASLAARGSEAASIAVASRFGALGGVVTALGPIGIATAAVFAGIGAIMRATAPEADALRISTLRLDSASRLTGVSLQFLQNVSRQAQNQFKLSAVQSNEFTTEIAKLTNKAGDIGMTSRALAAFLNVGAAQGMTAQQTLVAVRQAILGIDEGTDKLFQKNPSTIYKEFATSIGTTVGKLTDQQKAQALVNAAMEASLKVGDAYARFLDTAAGKQGVLDAASEKFQATLGRLFEPLRAWLAGVGASFLNWLTSIVELAGRAGGALLRMWRPGMGLAGNIGFLLGRGLPEDFSDVAGGSGSTVGAAATGTGVTTPGVTTGGGGGGSGTGETAAQRRRRLLDVLDAEAADSLAGGGTPPSLQGPVATRSGTAGEFAGSFRPAATRAAQSFTDTLRQELFLGLQRLRPFQNAFQGFFENLFAGGKVGASIKQFGSQILAGMGNIFAQMAMQAIAASPLFIAIGKAMSNPFTAGFALLAFGVALKALGSAMGGTATGSGGGGGAGGFSDTVTQITLTADGAGGLMAPKAPPGNTYQVIGHEHPSAPKIIGRIVKAGNRRNV
jgi:hypothetical protein